MADSDGTARTGSPARRSGEGGPRPAEDLPRRRPRRRQDLRHAGGCPPAPGGGHRRRRRHRRDARPRRDRDAARRARGRAAPAHRPIAGGCSPKWTSTRSSPRRPQLALVDELAHTNVADSRHPKRWQDVEELLDAGIDVYTTLNIQHLESLNDIVARISGVRVRETIPDKVLELADEIELIDLPPEELIARLRQGKVYVHDQIARAIQNFFSKGNLTALRELAMRVAADRVDAQMTAHMRSHAIAGPWPTHDRILVCINESPVAKALVRAAKRVAERARAAWIAVQRRHTGVGRPARSGQGRHRRGAAAGRVARRRDRDAQRRAPRRQRDSSTSPARATSAASSSDGRGQRRLPAALFRESVGRGDHPAAPTISRSPSSRRTRKTARARSIVAARGSSPERDPADYLWATAIVAVAGAVAFVINRDLPGREPVARLPRRGPARRHPARPLAVDLRQPAQLPRPTTSSSPSPYFTLHIADRERRADAAAVPRGRDPHRQSRRAAARPGRRRSAHIAQRTANLYDFSRKIASAASLRRHRLGGRPPRRLDAPVPVAGAEAGRGRRRSSIVGGYPPEDQLDARDWGAAKWAWEHGEPAGWGSQTLPSSTWLFLPLKTAQGPLAVLGVSFEGGKQLDAEEPPPARCAGRPGGDRHRAGEAHRRHRGEPGPFRDREPARARCCPRSATISGRRWSRSSARRPRLIEGGEAHRRATAGTSSPRRSATRASA